MKFVTNTKLRILRANDMLSVERFLFSTPKYYDLVAIPFISDKEWYGCKKNISLCVQRKECMCYRSLNKNYPYCILLSNDNVSKSINRAKETNNLLLFDNMLINLEKNLIYSCEIFNDLK